MNWVSVKDRLPLELDPIETYKDVEVLVTDGKAVAMHMFASGSVGDNWREWSAYGDMPHAKITHWMPLPEPPVNN